MNILHRLSLTLVFIMLSFSAMAERTEIKVGAYDYPPFMEWKNGKPTGLLLILTSLLNEKQSKYQFVIVETSAKRRYQDLYKKYYDVIFFENIDWSWAKSQVVASQTFLKGGELFIAKKERDRNQKYFFNLKGKLIRGFLGYHYAFLNFSTDPSVLKEWNIELTNSHDGNIISVIEGRADLAIVTREYLYYYFQKHPKAKDEILVSNKMDQIYQHTAIMRTDDKLKIKELNELLAEVKKDSTFIISFTQR